MSRKHFLNKCDIRNIRIKVQDRLVIRHEDDTQSVYLAVAELQQEPFNPVMAFKVQGSKNPVYPTLPENAFLLALQTEFQRELYQKYAGRVLCIDSTHGTNAYRYKLITCIVPDHYGQGDYINNLQSVYHNGHLCKHVHCVHALQIKTSTHPQTPSKKKPNDTVGFQCEEDDADIDMVSYGESCIIPSQG